MKPLSSRRSTSHEPLPFDADEPRQQDAENSSSEPDDDGTPRRGRPRKWDSEADRKRAYRERLAIDFAEPDRLRRELRAERKRVANKDLEIARLTRELAESASVAEALKRREVELEAALTNLRTKVEDWRSRARALSKKLDESPIRTSPAQVARAPSGAKPRHAGLPDLREGRS